MPDHESMQSTVLIDWCSRLVELLFPLFDWHTHTHTHAHTRQQGKDILHEERTVHNFWSSPKYWAWESNWLQMDAAIMEVLPFHTECVIAHPGEIQWFWCFISCLLSGRSVLMLTRHSVWIWPSTQEAYHLPVHSLLTGGSKSSTNLLLESKTRKNE